MLIIIMFSSLFLFAIINQVYFSCLQKNKKRMKNYHVPKMVPIFAPHHSSIVLAAALQTKHNTPSQNRPLTNFIYNNKIQSFESVGITQKTLVKRI